MDGKAKGWLVGSGCIMAITGYAALFITHTQKFVGLALDRRETQRFEASRRKLPLNAAERNFEETLKKAQEKLLHRHCKTVHMAAHDGESLTGHWQHCGNGKRVILAMHGWRSNWAHDFAMIADFLYDQDCHVLYAEQRGQGNSGGEHMGFGMTERYDCLDWVNWINQQGFSHLPVYLCGISMGASTVLMAAGLPLPENVMGIIADCGFTSANAIWKHVAKSSLHLPYGHIRSKLADRLCQKRIHMDSAGCTCANALAGSNIPVLFIHGTDDRFVPIEMTYENYQACTAPKRLFVVPGAGHGMSYPVDPEGYRQSILEFLKFCER